MEKRGVRPEEDGSAAENDADQREKQGEVSSDCKLVDAIVERTRKALEKSARSRRAE